MRITLKRGLRLPSAGQVVGAPQPAPASLRVAVVATDFRDLRPSLDVEQGDRVTAGDVLFTQRSDPRLRFVAPGSGRVEQINRGARRALESVVVALDEPETPERPRVHPRPPRDADDAALIRTMQENGLWNSLRTRPYDRIPAADARPRTLFVTAIDTDPGAMDPMVLLSDRAEDFAAGLECLARLAPSRLYVCTDDAARPTLPELGVLTHVRISGPHPAGCPGTHISLLDRGVSPAADTWHVGYQDVVALGFFYRTGCLDFERIVSVTGPCPDAPRVLRTRAGAELAPLLGGPLEPGRRLVSGSPLSGRPASGARGYLGPYHRQVTVMAEPRARPAWQSWAAALLGDLAGPGWRRRVEPTTALHGRATGMLPVEAFDAVWPLGSPPSALLRALLCGDIDTAIRLGCLALDEEDLAVCSYVCPAKQNYGRALRDVLSEVERGR